MTRRFSIALTALAAVIAGCATVNNDTPSAPPMPLEASWLHKISEATEPARDSLRQLTKRKNQNQPPAWNWTAAVPVDVKRSQVVGAVVSGTQIARIAPAFHSGEIALVSSPPQLASFRVTNVDGRPIRNCSDLFNACEQVAAHPDGRRNQNVQVDLMDLGAPDNSPETAIEVDPRQLVDLGQIIAPDQPAMRVALDGNPWVIYRERGIRSKLLARVETNCGLLHVVLSIANSGDSPELLPVEVRATCNQQKLKCLSVLETLETLWGQAAPNVLFNDDVEYDEDDYSFASVSEQEAYRLPLNYRKIQAAFDERFGDAGSRAVPAFAALPGQPYPGAATLGDARALSGFLMQRQICAPGAPENIGWLVFRGDSLRDGGEIKIEIDLGGGPQSFRFQATSQ